MKKWSAKRRRAQSLRMKEVWNERRELDPKGGFQLTKQWIKDRNTARDYQKERTLDQFFDMTLRFVGPEIMLNMLRRMVHDFIDGKDFKV